MAPKLDPISPKNRQGGPKATKMGPRWGPRACENRSRSDVRSGVSVRTVFWHHFGALGVPLARTLAPKSMRNHITPPHKNKVSGTTDHQICGSCALQNGPENRQKTACTPGERDCSKTLSSTAAHAIQRDRASTAVVMLVSSSAKAFQRRNAPWPRRAVIYQLRCAEACAPAPRSQASRRTRSRAPSSRPQSCHRAGAASAGGARPGAGTGSRWG